MVLTPESGQRALNEASPLDRRSLRMGREVTVPSSLLIRPRPGSLKASSLQPRANYRQVMAKLQKDIREDAATEKEQDRGSSRKYT